MEPPNNGHIGDRPLVPCREVVPISEVGIGQLAPRPCYARVVLLPDHTMFGRHMASTLLEPCSNGKHSTAMAIMRINVPDIMENRGSVRS